MLNIATNGRAIPVLSAGYVPAEFDMYGVLRSARINAVEEAVDICRKAWAERRENLLY